MRKKEIKYMGSSLRNISITTGFHYKTPINEQLKLIREAGFSHVSIGCDYEHSGILNENRLYNLKQEILKNQLQVDTVHGYDLDRDDTIEINEMIAKAATVLGAEIVVVHCSAFMFEESELEDKRKKVICVLDKLKQIAKRYKIQFAFENVVPGVPTDFCEEMIQYADCKEIGFCYDSSHDQIDGPRPMDLLKRQQSKLLALHISDRIREFVDHVIPDEGFINFDKMCELIRKSGYNRPLMLEVETTHSRYKNPEEFLKITYKKAVELYDKIYM